ncbi:MAG TPA: DUF4384 domain-containing protein [Gemmatimonadaceae bacterium]|nr:DUF4384 domain-containing protein [Gemmatimonadaceae bacterium]
MLSAALLSLFIPVAAGAGAPATAPHQGPSDEPPVRVSLDHRSYDRGDQARVTVRARDDGYLLVLHLLPDGTVRVLFPLDPGDDDFVRGGQEYEIRSRGDRKAFTVDASSGSGTVYAAWSREPYRFDDFVRGDHWDYRVLGDSALPNDPEGGLTNLVMRMSTAHFDYDIVSYDVAREVAYAATPVYYDVAAYYPPPLYDGCWYGVYDAWCGAPVAYYPYYRHRPRYFFQPGLTISFTFGLARPVYAFYDPFFVRGCYYSCGYHHHRVGIIRPGPFMGGGFAHGYGWSRPPYRFKEPERRGGGVGIEYRSRIAFAGGEEARPTSPLYAASVFRRASDGGRRDGARRVTLEPPAVLPRNSLPMRATSVGRRAQATDVVARGEHHGAVVFSPRDAASSPTSTDGPRRIDALPGERRGGIRSVDGAPRGARPDDGARRTEPGTATPRYYGPAGSADAPRREPPTRVEQRAEPRDDARRAEPQPRYEPPRAQPRSEPRYEPPRAQPRSEPRGEPRAEPRREPPPQRAEPRRAEPAPRRIEMPRGASGGGHGGRRP